MDATISAMPAPSDSVAPAPAASTLPPPLQQGGDVMHALHRIALGPTGAEHYLPHFALFDALDRTRTTWN